MTNDKPPDKEIPARGFFQLNADGGIIAKQGQAEGQASIGVVLRDPQGQMVHDISVRIGCVEDHHIAEYRALIAGLKLALGHGIADIRVRLDSALVVNAVNGADRVKPTYFDLCTEAHALVREFSDIEIVRVPSKENREAHALADKALRG
ncbi:MAG: ribonuclease / adenosylcobalamin/alpha-ribazole phosphatase [Actinomycetota bacterium]|jgi:ribonuclease HI|nr:ribonuclease / adenosylcobalamin/alpha-ribazole phosphatase [Actinomycetota bacterium]